MDAENFCKQHDIEFVPADEGKMIGAASGIFDGQMPLNGLRHPETETTTGWYIWAGTTMSDDPTFFQPMHLSHVLEEHPELAKYFGLAPGSRFLIDPSKNHEDVWKDDALLEA